MNSSPDCLLTIARLFLFGSVFAFKFLISKLPKCYFSCNSLKYMGNTCIKRKPVAIFGHRAPDYQESTYHVRVNGKAWQEAIISLK